MIESELDHFLDDNLKKTSWSGREDLLRTFLSFALRANGAVRHCSNLFPTNL